MQKKTKKVASPWIPRWCFTPCAPDSLHPSFPPLYSMDSTVKKEYDDDTTAVASSPPVAPKTTERIGATCSVIDLSSSDSDDDVGEGFLGKRSGTSPGGIDNGATVKRWKPDFGVLPLGFLDPLPLEAPPAAKAVPHPVALEACRQFWKAGEFYGEPSVDPTPVTASGMDHVRVHPKFLHSNATSHKWALGALAELLDNSLDEVCHGATFVNIDMLQNKKDGNKVLLVEDNGGGMDPDKMRQCMSLGYSVKSKIANTIGQYGNGFKTSTMRLGADVIVFSRSKGKGGRSPTQSIGMLSYTFLKSTNKEDIVVPMLDYEKTENFWKKMTLSTTIDWDINLETILQWSPYSRETELLQQFDSMTDQGTRVIIYNLWEDDQGKLELDFDADKHDIQIRGVNRDENKIQMAKKFPNSRHFLTYRHSLRSYASILYLRIPHGFRLILRGKEVEHHNIVNDMMMKQEVTYKPHSNVDGPSKDPTMVAVVTVGFVKDAKHHIDVQGFNVYHKNRLIKPFWRVWNPPGSDGRGVIGVLEANFVEPAHDKQDFERTIVLSRLENRLVQMQKTYWSTNCHRIGYAPRINKKRTQSEDRENSPEYPVSAPHSLKGSSRLVGKYSTSPLRTSIDASYKNDSSIKSSGKSGKNRTSIESKARSMTRDSEESGSESDIPPRMQFINNLKAAAAQIVNGKGSSETLVNNSSSKSIVENVVDEITRRSHLKVAYGNCDRELSHEDLDLTIKRLKAENEDWKERLKRMEESMSVELQKEKDNNKLLTEKLDAKHKELEDAKREQDFLIDIFSEERIRRDAAEESLRQKLKEKTIEIEELRNRLE